MPGGTHATNELEANSLSAALSKPHAAQPMPEPIMQRPRNTRMFVRSAMYPMKNMPSAYEIRNTVSRSPSISLVRSLFRSCSIGSLTML